MALSKVDRDRLKLGLFLLRISTGLFFLVWAGDKLVSSGHAMEVFEKFYFLPISEEIALALGAVQGIVVVAFMAGLYKLWTTGALLAMHTVSVGSTIAHLISPYGGPGVVFWAGVPVWFGLLLLLWMREADTMFTLKPGK